MTPEHARLIRQSWAGVKDSGQVVPRFYQLLFDLSPESRSYFVHTDSASLERKFHAMLDELVRVLDEPERLVKVLAPLGRRHAVYHVEWSHYEIAGVALIAALREVCGEAFTDEVELAWRELYGLVAAVMVRSATSRASRSEVRAGHGPAPT